MKRKILPLHLISFALLLFGGAASAGSLDLAINGWGVGLGNTQKRLDRRALLLRPVGGEVKGVEPHLEDYRLTQDLACQMGAQPSDGVEPELVETKLVNDRQTFLGSHSSLGTAYHPGRAG